MLHLECARTCRALAIVAFSPCPILAAGASQAQSIFVPVADTEIRADIPAWNFGTASMMGLDGDPVRIALMRFEVSVPPTQTVSKATLRLFMSSTSSADIFVNEVASIWGETTATFNNAPPIGARVATSGPITANAYQSIDVTSMIAGSGVVSMAVTRADTVPLGFNTRESAADRQPQLVVETVPLDAPPPEVPPTVSADPLPTWQINGVVWGQVVVGNIVYATGSFSKARPPGVAAGGPGEVDAQNIFAYDITTGERVSTFNHSLNAQGLTIAASPDGSRVYVGGDFTAVDGFARGHVASFRTASGARDLNFSPNVQGPVQGLAVNDTIVYVGGAFGTANGQPRSSLAALDAQNGSLLPWAPAIDTQPASKVWAMTLVPDGTRVVVGGSFRSINGTPAYGMGSVDATSGAVRPWAANQIIRNAGQDGAIYALRSDGKQVYGGGYSYGSHIATNFEGSFAADPTTGIITLVNDCHGDTYDLLPVNYVLYSVGHAHDCRWIGSFPDTSPRQRWQRALAQTIAPATVNIGPDDYGWNYAGLPASRVLHWFPQFSTGTYTGLFQGPYSLAGNTRYIALGGEFSAVNGVAQQGLVRMGIRSLAPNKRGPTYTTTPSRPIPPTTAVSAGSGAVRVTAGTAWDYDDETLRYDVFRNGGTLVYSADIPTNFWTLPTASFTDRGLTPGSTVQYQVRITDPYGNAQWSLKSSTLTVCCGSGFLTAGAGPSALKLPDAMPLEASLKPGKRVYVDPLAETHYRPVRRKGLSGKKLPASSSGMKESAVVRYSDRVSVSLKRVRNGKETGAGRGSFPGRPNTAFTLVVTNRSGRPLDLNQVVVTARYGSPSRVASPVYNDRRAKDFSGRLRSGGSAAATYVFAIPARAAELAAIVDFDSGHAPARFGGPKR